VRHYRRHTPSSLVKPNPEAITAVSQAMVKVRDTLSLKSIDDSATRLLPRKSSI